MPRASTNQPLLSTTQPLAGDLRFILFDVLSRLSQITLEPLRPWHQLLLDEFRLVGIDLSGDLCRRLEPSSIGRSFCLNKLTRLPDKFHFEPLIFLSNAVLKYPTIARQFDTAAGEFNGQANSQ